MLLILNYIAYLDFVRSLAVVRMKNPSRGAKKTKQDDASRKNPLNGLVEWIEVSQLVSDIFFNQLFNLVPSDG